MSAHTRTDRIICLMVTILLLLSGMYLDTAAPDDLFVYSSFPRMSMDAPQLDSNDARVCTTEMLNECISIQLQSEGRSVFLHLICAGQLALISGKILPYPKSIQTFCHRLDALVVEYMHQSDGKKRI
ncbi:MAG: hypothetical protein K2O40_09605 [Lachnospiraceae bacterium]|nr:hypothetical protein [Lachnospiraceae bacterium]